MIVLRSLLYVPGNNMRLITKAASLAADAIILDLEDAVPLADKETARVMIRDSVRAIKAGGHGVFVRVNSLATGLTEKDLEYVVVDGLDGVMLAKTEAGPDMTELDRWIGKREAAAGMAPGSVKMMPLVESAKGVIKAYEIASASSRIAAVAFGAGDYCRDMGRSVSQLTAEETELLYARSQLSNASRAAGVQALDTPFLGSLTDREGFMRESRLAVQLGFKGKQMIHPAQIEFINTTFSPPEDEVKYAGRLVAAFEKAQSGGAGAISFEGKMIDLMSYRQAKELLSLGTLIAEKEKSKEAAGVALSEFFTAR